MSADKPNSFDMSFIVSVLGTVSPVSQRETACLVTNRRSAISSWDRPRLCRSSVTDYSPTASD